jgi:hypothetical protein
MAGFMRVEFPGVVHQLISGGNARRVIFLDSYDRDSFGGAFPPGTTTGGQGRVVRRARGKIDWILNREHGVSLAEIAGAVGVCTRVTSKAIQRVDRKIAKV